MYTEIEISRLLSELARFRNAYDAACKEIDSIYRKLEMEEDINAQYRDFFAKNPEYCNWMRDHNTQFEAFKKTKYYIKKFSTVA